MTAIDLTILLFGLTFIYRGYQRGTIRAFVTLGCLVGAYAVSGLIPNLWVFFIRYFYRDDPHNAGLPFWSHLLTFLTFLAIFLVVGFVYTGLIESINLHGFDKGIGLVVGIVNAIAIACAPLVIIYSSYHIYRSQFAHDVENYSLILKVLEPPFANAVPAPKSPHHRRRPAPQPT